MSSVRARARSSQSKVVAVAATLGLAGAGLMVSLPAVAADPPIIPITGVSAALTNGTTDNVDPAGQGCLRVSPGDPLTSSDPVPNLGTAYMGHGFEPGVDSFGNATGTCPDAFDPAAQSNLAFTPMVPASATAGEPFLLGRVVHNNNVIAAMGTQQDYHMTGDLDLTIDTFADSFAWQLLETNNGDGLVDDVLTFEDVRSTAIVTASDGLDYRLVIRGFTDAAADGTCPRLPWAR